jgi:hypothetical protein
MNHSNCFYWWFIFNFVLLLLWFACSHGEDVPDDAVHIVYSGVHSPSAEDVALKLCKNRHIKYYVLRNNN